jgi:hypothetical protein
MPMAFERAPLPDSVELVGAAEQLADASFVGGGVERT